MKTKNKTLRFRECDVGDSMNVKKVLNLYRNVSEVKPNQSRMGKNSMDEICSFGDSACLHAAAAYNLNSLKDDDRKSIIEDMSDWEVYMFCKENEERKRVRYERTSVPIRNQNCSNTVIKVKSHQNNAADVSFFQVDKQEEDRTESPQNTRKEMSRADEAILEKILGNKCFEKGEYEAACQHYTNSLNLSFNLIDSYNNRAMCYIKLENYSAAFQDINEVLKRERGNEKALYRKVLSLKGMRMYEEALEEIRNYKSSNKRYLKVSMEIKDEISKLNGKKYNIRRRDGKKKKFQIDVSQLPVYANCDQSYLLEVDRMGCMRHCVCEYCTEEDQLNRSKSDSLRIRERARWKLLDYQLLKTIGVVKEQTNDFAANAVSNDYMLSEKPRNHKNETINGMTSAKSTNKTAVENVRPVHLNYASNDNFLKRKKETESHHRVDNNSSRNHDDDDSNAALLDDFSLTEMQSVNDLDTNKILKWTTYLKNTNAAILKKDFDITLSVDHLTIILKIIKTSFHLEKEWNKICDVLNAVSSIQQFPLVIKSVDENAKQDLRSLLHDAVVLKLENATIIEEKYFGSFSEV